MEKETAEKRLKEIIAELSRIFDTTFKEEKLVEQIQAILNAKDWRIAELESKDQKKRRALGIVTGEDVLINLRKQGKKI
jgi:hypothetical protein